ncbi:carbamoyltransferase HypF [Chloroflexota bacterium]
MSKTSVGNQIYISVRGVVQGVGFRPFVYQLATRYNLKGWVCNTSEDVRIEVQGDADKIEQFLNDLTEKAPPRASIDNVSTTQLPETDRKYKKFEIRDSIAEEGKYQLVSPDIATCPDCLSEILDPEDRRYRYPFTNCTNCGPRFTIIEDIPYDRPKTTMRNFKMCPECQREYDNPLDRRFHAQPNACPVCGPELQLLDSEGKSIETDDAIITTARLLQEGSIIAVKGLGGFLLACDATNESAINLLRQRKMRPTKPLAVMVASIDEAREHCYVNTEEENLILSPESPIVLMKWKDSSPVSAAMAPGLKYLGVMLAYTPLHHLLLRETVLPLVMTSGNLSEEPIAKDNDEAVTRLSGIADYFLVHNRDIYARYDDSVTLVEKDTPQIVRRARGYAPYPVHLGFDSKQILACGAEEKNTFCLTRDDYAFVSQHIGDMDNLETLESYENTIELYKKLFRIEPTILTHDMHPEYMSTRYAKEATPGDITLIPVQHHHAHIVSCMADNGIDTPVIGVAFDGTGYGTDGAIWGGELMIADYKGFTRAGQLEYLPLPGGALAIKKPYRTAIGYLLALLGEDVLDYDLSLLKQTDRTELDIIRKQVENKLNSPLTSSCGRLFDAISALIGVRREIDYEAQAAIELEMLACESQDYTGSYPFSATGQSDLYVVELKDLFSAIIDDLQSGIGQATIASRFHNSIARMILDVCLKISESSGIDRVALSGGVFQNRLLLSKTIDLLENSGLEVFTHRQVPTNDGGISLGQAVIANFSSV